MNKEERINHFKKFKFLYIGIAALLIVLIVSGILVINWLRGQVESYDKIYPGVTMGGMDLSGMTQEEAEAAILAKSEETFAEQTFSIDYEGVSVEITADEAGISYDAASLAKAAMEVGRDRSVIAQYGYIKKGINADDLEFSVLKSTDIVEEKVNKFIQLASLEMVEPTYKVEETFITLDKGQEERKFDRQAVVDEMKSRIESLTFGSYEPQPQITEQSQLDLEAIREEIFVEATQSEIKYVPLDWTEETADKYTEEDLKNYKGNHKYVITKGITGVDFDLEEAKKRMEESKRGFSINLIIQEPEDNRESIEAMLFRDVLSTWTTKLNPGERNRTHNIDLASKAVNGTVICPGDIFSYNGVVGIRSAAKGYRDAKIFQSGEVVDGIGGGICQLSSTIYIATLRAGLEPTERYAHRFAVSYTKLGQDATVAWGSLDYKFKNNTEWPIKVAVSRSGGSLKVTIYGTKLDNYTYELSSTQNSVKQYKTETKYVQLGSAEAKEHELTKLGQKKSTGGQLGYTSSTYITKYDNGKKVSTSWVNNSDYKTQDKITYIAAYLKADGTPYMDASGKLIDPNAVVEPTPTPDPAPTPDPTPPDPESSSSEG